MIDLVLATRNAHKVQEIQEILGKGFRVHSLKQYPNAPELIEDTDTFAGNATRKATQLAQWLGKPEVIVLADDSGLEVDALDGAPGVHSARFAATDATTGNAPDATNITKLMRLLENVPPEKRSARFRCVLALVSRDSVRTFDGTCEGHIAMQPSGSGGFGYDPVFIPVGFSKSFAELGEDTKNQISHRARALQKLKDYFNSPSPTRGGPIQPKA
ncbi:MAG TPA: RdgB/HAM1 family non-canonical purine NTP pyrophosphatase [Verrucomicrobiae bacterium]|nr:RdgB/HAM1 family non-canonical purine NTP pyrophosphatase [Verrucomicrobiae bacterium]